MNISQLYKPPTAQELRAAIAYEQIRPFGSAYRIAELRAQLEATLINPPTSPPPQPNQNKGDK